MAHDSMGLITFIGRRAWSINLNTEVAEVILVRHCFDSWGCRIAQQSSLTCCRDEHSHQLQDLWISPTYLVHSASAGFPKVEGVETGVSAKVLVSHAVRRHSETLAEALP